MSEIPESEDHKIPLFLYITYVVVFLVGLWGLFAYWNGSHGFLDRGRWAALQRAADTTYPFEPKNPSLKP